MQLQEKYILNNGIEVPKIGFGTWFINNKEVVTAVESALNVGYRHIDTASAYRNEKGVGQGIKKSGINREDIFITTKLAAEAKSYKKAKKEIEKSLKALDVEYIDMVIIHSPQPWTKFKKGGNFDEANLQVWTALEEAYNEGKIRAIGLSNFEKSDLDNILKNGRVKPTVNQVLAHIGNMPTDLIDYTKSHDIQVEAYSPIAHGVLLSNQTVIDIAAKYDVSVAQLSIRYLLQQDLLPLPKTTKEKHMINNSDVDFEISDMDMKLLHSIEPITDYGDAGAMPVYGGELNFKTMYKMITGKIK